MKAQREASPMEIISRDISKDISHREEHIPSRQRRLVTEARKRTRSSPWHRIHRRVLQRFPTLSSSLITSKHNYLQLRKLLRRIEVIQAHQFGSITATYQVSKGRDSRRTCRIRQSIVSLGKSARGDSEQMGWKMTQALTSEGTQER